MSYIKQTWETGDIITAEKLNHIEDGIDEAGASPYTFDPEMDGTASPGDSNDFARGDHVHPSDSSKQDKITASGILMGDGDGGVTEAYAGSDYVTPEDLEGKANVVLIHQVYAPNFVDLEDNSAYYIEGVEDVEFEFAAEGSWECWIKMETSPQFMRVIFPYDTLYIGGAPTFGPGETWEISIKDGVVVAGQVGTGAPI